MDVVNGVARLVPASLLGKSQRVLQHRERILRAAGSAYVSGVAVDSAVGSSQVRKLLWAARPILAPDSTPFGVLLLERDLGDWIDATLATAPPSVMSYMVNESGDRLGASTPPGTSSGSLAWLLAGMDDDATAAASARWDRLDLASGETYVARTRVVIDPGPPARSVTIAFAIERGAIMALVAPLRRLTIMGSVTAALTMLAAGSLIVAWALRPLRQLRVAAERIGAGDYTVSLPEADASEVGAFAAAFRAMVDGIRARDEQNQRVTERLREGEARFRKTMDDMQEGCQIIGFDWRYIYVNDSAARQGRRERAELIGRTMTECYPGIENTPLFAQLSESMSERRTTRLENEFTYPDGATAWFDLVVHPSHEGIFVTSYDITARKQAEREQRLAAGRVLKQVEHLTLLDQITRAIAERSDLNSIFQIVVNRVEEELPVDFACALLYDSVAHTLGVTACGAKAAAADPRLSRETSLAIDGNGMSRVVTGVFVYERDISGIDRSFTNRLASAGCRSLVLAPMRSENQVFGVLVAARRDVDAFVSTECEFLRQVTEHVALGARHAQLHSALQAAYDDLRHTQQATMQLERMTAMSQMASGIAHDINNALSPVSLYTEVLLSQETDLNARTREFLEQIRHSVHGVAETVSRMREFSRPYDRGSTPTALRLNEIVQKAIAFTHARWGDLAQRQGVTIQVATELADDLPEVTGVESEVRDALTNLIFNALDAMPMGGTMTMRTHVRDPNGPYRPRIVVEVSDDGVGMDDETRLRCIEPFFTTKGDRGTGLGLAMVFGMVQRHGAQLEIDSTLGSGSTFRILFPVASLARNTPSGGMATAGVRRALNVLLVDDDPVLLKSVEAAMSLDGHQVTVANGGHDGIVAFKRMLTSGGSFDVVITDLGMPHVDGRQVAAAVKELSPTTPVVMLTGWGRRMLADQEVPPHVDQILSKPPTLQELRLAIIGLTPPEKEADA